MPPVLTGTPPTLECDRAVLRPFHWNEELNAIGETPKVNCVLCDWRSDM